MTDATPRLYADDLTVGAEIDLGGYRLEETELVDFAGTWDPQDFHVDREVAEQGVFGGLIGSGVHSIAIFQRLCVLGAYRNWHVIAARRINRIEFTAPIRPGDLLTARVRVVEVMPQQGRSLVRLMGTLVNQHGAGVMEMELEVYLKNRPA